MMQPGEEIYPSLPSTGDSPPLSPEMQRRLKALIQQLRGALQRHQLSPEVEAEISHLVNDLDLAQNPQLLAHLLRSAIDTDALSESSRAELMRMLQQSVATQRITALAEQVHGALGRSTLPRGVQRELSRLLTLLPALHHHLELIDQFEFAITALLPVESEQPPNLPTARHLRRHLSAQLQQTTNPLWSIIVASGSSHNRLVSGLSWFLITFTLLPTLLLAGFFVSGVTQQHREIERLQEELTLYQERLARASRQVGLMTERIGTANQRLSGLGLGALVPSETDTTLTVLGRQELVVQQLESTLTDSQQDLAQLRNSLLPQLRRTLTTARENNFENPAVWVRTLQQQLTQSEQRLAAVQSQLQVRDPASEQLVTLLLKEQLAELRAALTEASETVAATQALMAEALLADAGDAFDAVDLTVAQPAVDSSEIDGFDEVTIAFLNAFLRNLNTIDLPLMLAVVATGALGSFVSVIVRAREFIDQEKTAQLDLFLVGFFRPIVGMAFAFFLVAVLESGIFASVLSINTVRPEKKIYLYVAIAFVAGFSERLVKDLVGQTSGLLGARNRLEP